MKKKKKKELTPKTKTKILGDNYKYYESKFIQNPEFYIFSNDQDWCLNHLGDVFSDSLVHFITHNKGINSYRDMQLMMLARCNILANSSFSWWGAYLNQRDDQLVFCPNKWHNQFDCSKIYVDSWIKIDIG